ncbi:NADH dehydrogenase Fe-S protein subunit 6 ndufs6 [Sparganum proliferum]
MSRVLRSRILKLSLRPLTSKPSTAVESASCPTHTGQVFDQHDFRIARFMESAKLVNKSFAADLINQIPPKKVTSHITYCDGGGGALGHPKVYINLAS